MQKLTMTTTKEWLEEQRTRFLLQLKKDYNGILQTQGAVHYRFKGVNIYFDLDDINEVLSSRGHIPSKPERKVIRQEAAKTKSRWYVTPF